MLETGETISQKKDSQLDVPQQAIKPASKRFREQKKFTSQQTVTHSRATTMGTMQFVPNDQTMILPEGVEISFELGGGASASNKWKRRVNNQQQQVFSSHNVIGQGMPTFGEEIRQFRMGAVNSIEDVELPKDERSSLSSIPSYKNQLDLDQQQYPNVGGDGQEHQLIPETDREEVLNESSLADAEIESESSYD